MKPSLLLLALMSLFLTRCSLVTVPVKTAGNVVETTVTTAGKVAEAPFKAVGGRQVPAENTETAQPSPN
jgi:hypothetical protein